jgi:hypothetical protein
MSNSPNNPFALSLSKRQRHTRGFDRLSPNGVRGH